MRPPVAAVDCGTNSTRLLIAGPDGAPVARLMRITRLGAGVDQRRTLDPAAVARTVEVLRQYRQVMDSHGVGPVRMTATSAARDAANRDEFFTEATEAVGVAPELLSGEEEGRLSFLGATADLPDADAGRRYLVADIGGGSTELAAGRRGCQPDAIRSLDVGCVRVTERWLAGDPPRPAQVAAARAALEEVLAGVGSEFRADTLIGLAGTVSSLAAIDQELTGYDRDRLHHYQLTAERVESILAQLAAVPAAARARRPGVEQGRADVIVGGALILAALMATFGLATCLTSEADILDGLVLSLLG